MPYYSVRQGRQVGVYQTWGECYRQVYKFSGAQYKKFDTEEEALGFLKKVEEKTEKTPRVNLTNLTSVLDPLPIRIYTDGACKGNPGPCAAAALFVDTQGEEISRTQYLGQGTNNIAELEALYLGCLFIDDLKDTGKTSSFVLVSDSQYAVNVVQGIWQPKANLDLVAKIRAKLLNLQRQGKTIQFEWVKAHHLDPLNHRVDSLAGLEIKKHTC